MRSPSADPAPGDQRARLLELGARQQQLKRLCEEALKEEEQHQHIFQQLEERNTVPASSTGSFAGIPAPAAAAEPGNTAGGGYFGSAATGAGPYARLGAGHAVVAEPYDDLLTGEVHSFRDPNSIARASSTGSAAAAPGLRGNSASWPRNPSTDRPRTRLDDVYRPPAHPGLAAPRRSASGSGNNPPPVPPRATLYTGSRRPNAGGAARTALSPPARNRHTGLSPPPPPPLSEPITAPELPIPIPHTWQRRAAETPRQSPAADKIAGRVPLSPPPPPPPERDRSRSASHSVPLTDRYRRSPGTHATGHNSAPPPPPPPPPPRTSDYSAYRNRSSPLSASYGTRAAPLSPSSPPASPLVSPDELTDNLPPPPGRTQRRTSPARQAPRYTPAAAAAYRTPRSALSSNPRMPPPPPPPPSASAVPPPPPPPPPEPLAAQEDSLLSTTSTELDIARWRRHLSGGTGPYTRVRGSSWGDRRASQAPPLTSAGAARTTAPHREDTAGKASRNPPPPPPPPLTTAPLSPPSRCDDDDALRSRWETISLTPSLRRTDERHLRRYFDDDDRESENGAAPWRPPRPQQQQHRAREYVDYSRASRAPPVSAPPSQKTSRRASLWETAVANPAAPPPPTRPQPASASLPPTAPSEHTASTRWLAASSEDVRYPTPQPLATAAPSVAAEPAAAVPGKTKHMHPTHPYGVEQPQSASVAPLPDAGPYRPPASAAPAIGRSASGEVPAPLYPTFQAQHARTTTTTTAGLNSSHNSIWNDTGATAASAPPPPPPAAAAMHTAHPSQPPVVTRASDFFDMGPEKEALLSLLRESTRGPLPGAGDAAPQRTASPTAAPGAATRLPDPNPIQSLAAPTVTTTVPQHFHEPGRQRSYVNAAAEASLAAGQSLQQRCDEAQAKAEALARHLVKAISDRKMLQTSVEELETLVEECNAEVGRLQQVVEEQHQDSATSLGVQAALRAKEREVAVYEDEIRRLSAVLDGHLSRTATSARALEDEAHHELVAKEAEVEAAMTEVGLAHLAQREAEERAAQLANELETAVEQIQFLDERLAEMERAAAAAQFQQPTARLHEDGLNANYGANDLAPSLVAAPLDLPPDVETKRWPLEARRAMAYLVGQAEALLHQNAEGARHAAMRLQHVENTCEDLQRHLRERDEEVNRARAVCEQLRQEKSALQSVGEVWFQQLRDVKDDAQLVSEMMRTSRADAEDVYLAARVAEEQAAEQRAAVAAASPLRPSPSPAPADPVVLKKSVQFAQQVMRDFHAVARFLSSLRTMDIGDRNAYQILQSIASGHQPADGLFVTADTDATPKRLCERLSPNVTNEAKRRVEEKKARVLRAVERALSIDHAAPSLAPSLDVDDDAPAPHAPIILGRPPLAVELRLPTTAMVAATTAATDVVEVAARTELCEIPDSFEDEDGAEAEVEVVSSSLHPARLGSHSLRGGSSGMVHSDVRPLWGGSGSSASAPPITVLPPAPGSATRTATPFLTTPTAWPGLAGDGRPLCSTLYMGNDDKAAAKARPTQAPPTSPPPSVSRPLRLSTTPSQPRSDCKPERFDAEEEDTAAWGSATAAPELNHTRMSSRQIITTDSTPLRGHGAGADPDMSSITFVSSPSMSQQALPPPPPPQRQWQQPPPTAQVEPRAATPLSSAAPTPSVATSPPLEHLAANICASSLPSVSDIAVSHHDSGVPASHDLLQQHLQQQGEGKTEAVPREAAITARVSPSPTPDRQQAESAATHAAAGVVVASPIERPRTPTSSVDEPAPRAVVNDADTVVRPLGYPGSQPKDRSTTARPSSSPPHRHAAAGRADGAKHSLRHGSGQRRPAAANEDDSDNDEATLFFSEPPRGVVHEVSPCRVVTRVEVPLLADDVVLPSRQSTSAPVRPPATSAPPPARQAPSTPPLSEDELQEEEEADLEERVPPSSLPSPPTARPTSLVEPPRQADREPATASAPPPPPSSAAEVGEERKPSMSRARRVVVDEDDEPSLSFLVAPLPLPPPVRTASASPLSVEEDHASRSQSGTVASHTMEGSSGVGVVRARGSGEATMAPVTGAAPSSLGTSTSLSAGPHRAMHQPRRPPASDSGPTLSAGAGAVDPPRLQRSVLPASWAAPPLPPLGTRAPSPAAVVGAGSADAGGAPGGVRQRSRSGSLPASAKAPSVERELPERTPALSEPQRPSPPTPLRPASMAAAAALTSSDAAQTEPEVVIHVDADDLLWSDTKASAHTAASSPARRLPSITSTVAPDSPAHSGDAAPAGLGLPGEVQSDTPGVLGAAMSTPAEPLQGVSAGGLDRSRDLPARPGSSRQGSMRGASAAADAAPAPLPTVNADEPESNTLGLQRAPPQPPASSALSTPRSATPGELPLSDEAAAKRRDDVARILERIRAKKEQEVLRSGSSTPPTPLQRELSSARVDDVDSSSV